MSTFMNMYMHYLTNGIARGYDNGNWRIKAIEGLGAVFIRRPKYMLKPGIYADDGDDEDSMTGYADDVGMVLADIRRNLPAIHALFQRFGGMSNLRLNISKCIALPLCHPNSVPTAFEHFIVLVPAWAGFSCQLQAI